MRIFAMVEIRIVLGALKQSTITDYPVPSEDRPKVGRVGAPTEKSCTPGLSTKPTSRACKTQASAATIRRAHAVCPLTAVQLEWSLCVRDAEDEVIPTCVELGIGAAAGTPRMVTLRTQHS